MTEETPPTASPARQLLDRMHALQADRLQHYTVEQAEALVVYPMLDVLVEYVQRRHPLALESLVSKALARISQGLDYNEAHNGQE